MPEDMGRQELAHTDAHLYATRHQQAAEFAALDPALQAEVEPCAAALLGLDPDAAWARLRATANTIVEMLRAANPGIGRERVERDVLLWVRCTRRRSIQLANQERSSN